MKNPFAPNSLAPIQKLPLMYRIKTKLSVLRYKIRALPYRIQSLYYKVFHGIHCSGMSGSMLPKFSKGKFVSVLKRGSFIDIIDHRRDMTIRIVPYQPNHGVMLEIVRKDVGGKEICGERVHMDFGIFERYIRRGQESLR